MRNNLKKTQIA